MPVGGAFDEQCDSARLWSRSSSHYCTDRRSRDDDMDSELPQYRTGSSRAPVCRTFRSERGNARRETTRTRQTPPRTLILQAREKACPRRMSYELDTTPRCPTGSTTVASRRAEAVSQSDRTLTRRSRFRPSTSMDARPGELVPDGASELFGLSVSLSGAYLAVGAPNHGGSYRGAVYMYSQCERYDNSMVTERCSRVGVTVNGVLGWQVRCVGHAAVGA